MTRYEKTREQYHHFLSQVPREAQGQQFFHAMISLLKSKGAVDMTKHMTDRHLGDLETTFCGHLCKLFDQKIEAWFDSFEAVNVKLTAHVKVSNLVRVLSGQVDLLCRKDGVLFAVNIKVTGMPTPRPMDVNELCLVKAMVIQNGLADPDAMGCCLLVCHLAEDRPVLRLWEYRPTRAMDTAIKEADVDHMIDAGKQSQMHELWSQNVCPPGVASLTARLPANNGPANNGPANNGAPIPKNMVAKSSHPPQVVGNLNNPGHPNNPDQPYNQGQPPYNQGHPTNPGHNNQQGSSRRTPSLAESIS